MALISKNTHNADNTSLNTVMERGGVKGGKRAGKRMQVLQNVKNQLKVKRILTGWGMTQPIDGVVRTFSWS